jgi:hypothetical protein
VEERYRGRGCYLQSTATCRSRMACNEQYGDGNYTKAKLISSGLEQWGSENRYSSFLIFLRELARQCFHKPRSKWVARPTKSKRDRKKEVKKKDKRNQEWRTEVKLHSLTKLRTCVVWSLFVTTCDMQEMNSREKFCVHVLRSRNEVGVMGWLN